jgi:hypothetical protein
MDADALLIYRSTVGIKGVYRGNKSFPVVFNVVAVPTFGSGDRRTFFIKIAEGFGSIGLVNKLCSLFMRPELEKLLSGVVCVKFCKKRSR